MQRLDGKVALVTGAGRGLGWGIARALGQAGAQVCLTDINPDELDRALADMRGDGSQVMARLLDVAGREDFQATVDAVVATWGRLDILVHNAIYMPLVRFDDMSPDLWQRQLDVSLGGLYNATYAAWDVMKAQGGGHIIGIASGSSVRGYKEEVAYCTAKHAQEGFIKALALEAAAFAIALNSIGPGRTIKPTRLTWAELDALPSEEKAQWADPVALGEAFVWLAAQPPTRFSGLRFDAGPIVDTIAAEGFDFAVTPEKVTLYVDDFVARQQWQADHHE
ncbi:MAG: SDR family oxidoreductase [Caldilineaceae bacterium]|jgi:NAD(P)-dependent dehydrogenase (short-subunit alcohol dehydrogenase family)|nr:SDR family oxidoreductase [Caldilineaceae bacterium]